MYAKRFFARSTAQSRIRSGGRRPKRSTFRRTYLGARSCSKVLPATAIALRSGDSLPSGKAPGDAPTGAPRDAVHLRSAILSARPLTERPIDVRRQAGPVSGGLRPSRRTAVIHVPRSGREPPSDRWRDDRPIQPVRRVPSLRPVFSATPRDKFKLCHALVNTAGVPHWSSHN